MSQQQSPGFYEYEVDIAKFLRTVIPPFLKDCSPAQLALANINAIPSKAMGVYILYEKEELVYVGKTDAEEGFRSRLTRHFHGVRHRKNIDPNEICFVAVRIPVFHNAEIETMLIETLGKPKWNLSGFGSNDPGHNREDQRASDFDTQHPVDIDIPLEFVEAGKRRVLDLLIQLKDELPYTFRYETDAVDGKRRNAKHGVGHVDQRSHDVDISVQHPTMRECLKSVVSVLPVDWVATLFPNRVILYKEKGRPPYKNAKEIIA